VRLARQLASFGARSQVGDFLWLTSLRLDFAFVTFFAGPVTLGILRSCLPGRRAPAAGPVAFAWVLFPANAKDGKTWPSQGPRPASRATLITVAAAIPLGWAPTSSFRPLRPAFRPAIIPTEILICGLRNDRGHGVIGPFLRGIGRPGLESLAVGAGAVLTLGLDVVLIPQASRRWGRCGIVGRLPHHHGLLLIAFFRCDAPRSRSPCTGSAAAAARSGEGA